jgi:hypothetical protein
MHFLFSLDKVITYDHIDLMIILKSRRMRERTEEKYIPFAEIPGLNPKHVHSFHASLLCNKVACEMNKLNEFGCVCEWNGTALFMRLTSFPKKSF